MQVIKRDKSVQEFDFNKIVTALNKAFGRDQWFNADGDLVTTLVQEDINNVLKDLKSPYHIEDIQNIVENVLMANRCFDVAKKYILYREKHAQVRREVEKHLAFIEKYKKENTPADATVDDNANVRSRSVANMNAEIKKEQNILINRGIVMDKLRELFPDFDAKQYARDLENRVIYKHDESSSNSGPTLPYCCSSSMYPFLLNGIKDLGGLSAAPKNIDSFCGMFCNLVFTEAGQFLGATAFPLYLFCKERMGKRLL